MRRAILGICCAAAFALAPTARAASIVLDAMTDAFPPNPCLPVSGQHIVFLGSVCDGATCPPGSFVDSSCPGAQYTTQVFLPGLHPDVHDRSAQVTGGYQAIVAIDAAQHRLQFADVGSSFIGINVSYGGSAIDLVSMGAVAIRIPLQGDITSTHPLWCIAQLSANGLPGQPSARLEIQATRAGDLILPLAAFAAGTPFTYGQLTGIDFSFGDCLVQSCARFYPERAYSIGPITFETDLATATATGRRTWGALKSIYR